jgi:hypothetical protein
VDERLVAIFEISRLHWLCDSLRLFTVKTPGTQSFPDGEHEEHGGSGGDLRQKLGTTVAHSISARFFVPFGSSE